MRETCFTCLDEGWFLILKFQSHRSRVIGSPPIKDCYSLPFESHTSWCSFQSVFRGINCTTKPTIMPIMIILNETKPLMILLPLWSQGSVYPNLKKHSCMGHFPLVRSWCLLEAVDEYVGQAADGRFLESLVYWTINHWGVGAGTLARRKMGNNRWNTSGCGNARKLFGYSLLFFSSFWHGYWFSILWVSEADSRAKQNLWRNKIVKYLLSLDTFPAASYRIPIPVYHFVAPTRGTTIFLIA